MQKLIENYPSDWGKNVLHLREIKVKNKMVEANGKSVQVDKGYEVGCLILDTKNKNGRIYSSRLVENICREGPQKTFALKDHPQDDSDEGLVENIVAVSENPHIRDGVFYVNTFFVDEEFQEKVNKIISRGIGLGVSIVGFGNVGKNGIVEDYQCSRFFDFVISPSGNVYLTKESILENEKYHSEMEQQCFKHLSEAAKKYNKGEKKMGSVLDEKILEVIRKPKKENQKGLREEGIFEITPAEQEYWRRIEEEDSNESDENGENETTDDDKLRVAFDIIRKSISKKKKKKKPDDDENEEKDSKDSDKEDEVEESFKNKYRRYKTMRTKESLPYVVDSEVDILVLQNRQERRFALKGFWESSVKERLNREALDYLSHKNGNEKISVGLDKAEKTLFIFSDVLAEDLHNFEFDDKGELTVDQIDGYTPYNNLLLVGGANTLNENISQRDRMPAMREGWETAPVAKKRFSLLREGWM